MSKLRHLLVSTEALHAWAQDLDLPLRTSGGAGAPAKLKTAFRKPLADAVEALLAAVFMDRHLEGGDGLAAVLRLLEGRYLEEIQRAEVGVWESHDPKTTLQERAAALGLPHPSYELAGRRGPDHAPRFQVRVRVGPHEALAEEGSRRGAEAKAAAGLLAKLSREGGP